jgi:steroid delta-isomerase-like uncharacterized protein
MERENAALVRRWFEEVWNQGRAEVIDELFAPDGVAHGLGGDGADLPGPEGFKKFHAHFRQAFPDLRIELEEVMTSEDRTIVRFRCRGTHQGELLGIPPTGRTVDFTGITITRWRDGQVAEGWNEINFLDMLRQIAPQRVMEVRP